MVTLLKLEHLTHTHPIPQFFTYASVVILWNAEQYIKPSVADEKYLHPGT